MFAVSDLSCDFVGALVYVIPTRRGRRTTATGMSATKGLHGAPFALESCTTMAHNVIPA